MDIAAWLRELGLERYEPVFRDNEIDAEVLPRLTAEDLTALGVTAVGHRRRLLDALAALSKGNVTLATGPAELAADTTASTLSEGERRQVTVLFADLSGYTRLSREIDAEELHVLAGRFFDVVDAVVEGYGGTVRKHIGDCIMAVFGAPVAHSNDPERAARAALDIQHRVPALADERGRPLGVHIGVASGQVVASGTGSARHREYTVTGESVNLASRLTDAAQAGEVLISDAVHRALAERLACAEAGALAVKGFAEPVRAWRLLGLREATEPGDRLFVGRRSELQRFGAILAARLGSARRDWSRSSRRRRGTRGSSAKPGWCWTSAPAPARTPSARSCAACSASNPAAAAIGRRYRPRPSGRSRTAWWRRSDGFT